MMSNYPAGKDNLTVDTAGTDEMTAHAELHNSANDAINAIQDFVGVTQGDGSTTVVEGINIISGKVDGLVEGLEDALGVNIDIDGNITIDPDKPSIIVPEPDDSKFDRGEGELNYANAVELGDAVDALKQNGGSGGDDKFDRGTGDLEYPNAVAMGAAVRANEGDINTNAGNITINSENFASLLAELNLTIDGEGNISINPNPPSNPNLDISSKFDKGTGDLEYKDAVVLGQAVKTNEGDISKNANNINNLLAGLNLEINPDGSVNIIGGGQAPDISELEQGIANNATAIEGKFDIGAGTTTLNDATVMEAAIDENAVNIETLVVALGGSIDSIGDIEIDALPDQDGKDGQFLTTDGDKASWAEIVIPDALPDGGSEGKFLSVNADGDAIWAEPKTADIKLSADDTNSFVVIDELGEFENQSDVNTTIAEKAYFRGQTITWGELANKTTG
jgi:hypothetical protein